MTATAPKLVESPPMQQKNLIQKCASVMASLAHVPKRGHNSFHNYDYATEADIADAVRESMAREGVMLIPSVEKCDFRDAPTKSGMERGVTLTVKYRLTDGTDSIEFNIIGEGQDRGDKATYKAMTGATKYALLKLFLISTGDDPEADDGEKPPPARGSVSAPRAPTPAPAKPNGAAHTESPPYVIAAYEKFIAAYGSKASALDPWKVALAKVIGKDRDSKSMSQTEALDVEALCKPPARSDDINY